MNGGDQEGEWVVEAGNTYLARYRAR